MQFLDALPVWLLGLLIFSLRIIDVSLGTVRTISVVQGWIKLSVVLGFFEVLLWIAAVSQVIARIKEHPVLMLAFAGGFAAGNAAGILLERAFALGSCVVQMVSSDKGPEIAEALRGLGQRVTTFEGQGRDGSRTMIYLSCGRRDLRRIVERAKAIDPQLFYVADRLAESSHLAPLPHATGWRAALKMK